MSEEFKPGQTVYSTSGGEAFVVIAQDDGDVWGRWASRTPQRDVVPADWLTATDPSKPAESVPQNCPFCGVEAMIPVCDRWVECGRTGCDFRGPYRPTRLQAVQAWNSIRVGNSQLPEGMEHCKILFKKCENGHGRLMATNWVDHGCLFCKVAEEREACAEIAELGSEWQSVGKYIAQQIRKRGRP